MQNVNEFLADFYLEWFNNWLTHEAYAEHHEMELACCVSMINRGRECHEARAAKHGAT